MNVDKAKRALQHGNGADKRTKEEKEADLAKAIAEAEQLMIEEDASPESVRTELPAIRSKYRLVSLELQEAEKEGYYVEGKVNPSAKSRIHELGAVEVEKLRRRNK